jgi:hypothetical protein
MESAKATAPHVDPHRARKPRPQSAKADFVPFQRRVSNPSINQPTDSIDT